MGDDRLTDINKDIVNGNTIRGLEYLIDGNKVQAKMKRINEGIRAVLNEQKKQQQQQQERKKRARFHNVIKKYKKDLKCAFDFDAISECYKKKGCTAETQKEAYQRGSINYQDIKL